MAIACNIAHEGWRLPPRNCRHVAETPACAIRSVPAFAAAYAGVDLIAVDGLSAQDRDLSTRTAAPLENGAPGNMLGGLGSGFTYAGGTTYLALPDRGPNAVAYNDAIDSTTSYIPRFQSLRIVLTPNASGASLPYSATPTLTGTTYRIPPCASSTSTMGFASNSKAVDPKAGSRGLAKSIANSLNDMRRDRCDWNWEDGTGCASPPEV